MAKPWPEGPKPLAVPVNVKTMPYVLLTLKLSQANPLHASQYRACSFALADTILQG